MRDCQQALGSRYDVCRMMHVFVIVFHSTLARTRRHTLFGVLGDVESGHASGDGAEATVETSC